MRLSDAQLRILRVVQAGGHISWDRFAKRWRLIPKAGEPTFVTKRTVDTLIVGGHLRVTDRRYETAGTHRITTAGEAALRGRG